MAYKQKKILVNAYACGPHWGSEIGMGWNWVINLSNYCELTVITEKGFQSEIEKALPLLNLKYTPKFHYLDIGDRGRFLFWKQGSYAFYTHYRKWQKKAYGLAKKLVAEEKYDIIHQLNMIGYREPGYLWKIKNHPFIWGPVGGFNQMPWNYLLNNKIEHILFYTAKNVINYLQKKFVIRIRKVAKRANIIIAATKESKVELDKISGKNSYLMGETGCEPNAEIFKFSKNKSAIFQILWVGRFQAMKALPLALETLHSIKDHFEFQFIIIGDGPDEKRNKELAKKFEIDDKCTWLGRIPNEKVIERMRHSDLLFFTSLKEGTPHVVMEALQNGLPVLCHDACGHGIIINDNCGRKIPMINYQNSIKEFGVKLLDMAENQELLVRLSKGAMERSKEVTWKAKANEMLKIYNQVL